MEHTQAQRLQWWIILRKHCKDGDDPGQLKGKGQFNDGAYQPHHALQTAHIHGFPDQGTLPQADAPSRSQGKPHADGGNAQTADLDQHRHHSLPHGGKGIGGIHGQQAGYTDGACGGKQSVHRLYGNARPDGKWHEQQKRTQ